MTAEEIKNAIKYMKGKLPSKVDYAKLVCAEGFAYGHHFVYEDEEGYIIEDVINVLQKELERTEINPLTIEQFANVLEDAGDNDAPLAIMAMNRLHSALPDSLDAKAFEISEALGDYVNSEITVCKIPYATEKESEDSDVK